MPNLSKKEGKFQNKVFDEKNYLSNEGILMSLAT